MPAFIIAITSDTVCPWCYVGSRRLTRAINTFSSQNPSSTFHISWHPFYLDPSAPTTGIPLRDRMISKFGSAARVDQMQARMAQIGVQEDIAFDFGARTGSTRDSHRLIAVAGQEGGEETQGRVVAGLFRGYFEQGVDVTDRSWLETVGRESGLGEEVLRRWREEDAAGKVVDVEAQANRQDTNGVPRFLVNGKFVLEGAQEPEEFMKVFESIAKGAIGGQTSSGSAC